MGLFRWWRSRKKNIVKIESSDIDALLPASTAREPQETPTPNSSGDSPQSQAFWDDITRTDITPPNLTEIIGDLNELLSQPDQDPVSEKTPVSKRPSTSKSTPDPPPVTPKDNDAWFDAIADKNDLSTTDKLTNLTDAELMQRLRDRSKEGVQTNQEVQKEDQEIIANLEKQRAFARVVTQNHLVSENDLNDFFTEYGKRIRTEFIGALMVEARLITESRMNYLLSRNFKIMSIDLQLYEILPSVLDKLDREAVCEETVIPVDIVGNVLTLASSNPFNMKQIMRLEAITQKTVRPVYCKLEQLIEYIEMYYPAGAATVHLEEMGVPEGDEDQKLHPDEIDQLSSTVQARAAKKDTPASPRDEIDQEHQSEVPDTPTVVMPAKQPAAIADKVVAALAITDSTLKRRQTMRTAALSHRWSDSFLSTATTKASKVTQIEFEALFGHSEFSTILGQQDTDSSS